ncbi:MAG: two-component regulator propeller domain-containing protein [Bacteroidia bacterium]
MHRFHFFQSLLCILLNTVVYHVYSKSVSENHPDKLVHITTHDGLSSNRAWTIFNDTRGFIWVCTTDGLNMYDGKSFKNYYSNEADSNSLCSNIITNIQEKKNGNLLIATSKGISEFDIDQHTFKTIFIPPSNPNQEFSNGIAQILYTKKGELWIATRHSLYCLDSMYRNLNFPENKLYGGSEMFRLLEDTSGSVWLNKTGYLNKITFQNGMFTVQNKQTNPGTDIYSTVLIDYQTDHTGMFWGIQVGTNQLVSFNSHFEINYVSSLPSDQSYNFTSLYITREKNIWILTSGHGALKFNLSTGTFLAYYHDDKIESSLCCNDVKNIVEDVVGNIWFGTDDGLDLLPYTKIKVDMLCSPMDSSSMKILKPFNALYKSDTCIWLAQWASGICHLDRKSRKCKWFSIGEPTGVNFVFDILPFGNSLLYGTFNGIHLLHPATGKLEVPSISWIENLVHDSIPVTGFYKDSHQSIWISLGNGRGIIKTDTTLKTIRRFNLDKIDTDYFPFRNFTSVAEIGKNILVMGNARSNGLAIFDYEKNTFEYRKGNSACGFDDQVNCLLTSGDYLWIGSNSGVYKINFSKKELNHYTRIEGLPGNNINSISRDGSGNVWIATYNGLSVFNEAQNSFQNFNKNDGLPDDYLEAIEIDSRPDYLLGLTANNFFTLNTANLLTVNTCAPPVILSMKVMGKEVQFNRTSPLEISYENKFINIEFTAPCFARGSHQYYSYKLEGYDTNWVFVGTNQLVSLTDLPEGSYKFRVRTTRDFKQWTEAAAGLNFNISIPFYLKTWFKIMAVFFLIGIVVAAIFIYYRMKLNRILISQKIRNRIANDLHDDIGSSLSSISYMAEIAKMYSDKKETEYTQYLNKIGETSRNLIDNMSDIIWSVNPDNDISSTLVTRMRSFAEEYLKLKEIKYTFYADETVTHIQFSLEERRNLYLIFKEVLHNIMEHSGCNQVSISFQMKTKTIELEIQDNGSGFDTQKIYDGNGLKNITKRAGYLSAHASFDSVKGKGTRFMLTFYKAT